MSSKKIFTVFGATGNQGGSVISTLLAHPDLASQYHIKGVTRDPTKPSAQKLSDKGVEAIKADVSDPSSLAAALKDSYAVFALTNYWDTMSKSTEIEQGKNIVDASIKSGVKHLIWSNLPDVAALTNGQLKNVEHFDSKAEIGRYADSRKSETGMIITHFMPGYFMTNVKSLIRKDPEGVPTMAVPFAPDSLIPLLDPTTDTGKFVVGILAAPSSAIDGKHIQGTSVWQTPTEILSTISHVSGTKVEFKQIPAEVWAGFLPLPPHAQKELGENMTLIREYSYFGKGTEKLQGESDEVVRGIGETLTGWEEFVKREGPWTW